jgi:hypothetical protein
MMMTQTRCKEEYLLHWLSGDHLGSTSRIVDDATLSVRERTKYKPWGYILSIGIQGDLAREQGRLRKEPEK